MPRRTLTCRRHRALACTSRWKIRKRKSSYRNYTPVKDVSRSRRTVPASMSFASIRIPRHGLADNNSYVMELGMLLRRPNRWFSFSASIWISTLVNMPLTINRLVHERNSPNCNYAWDNCSTKSNRCMSKRARKRKHDFTHLIDVFLLLQKQRTELSTLSRRTLSCNKWINKSTCFMVVVSSVTHSCYCGVLANASFERLLRSEKTCLKMKIFSLVFSLSW